MLSALYFFAYTISPLSLTYTDDTVELTLCGTNSHAARKADVRILFIEYVCSSLAPTERTGDGESSVRFLLKEPRAVLMKNIAPELLTLGSAVFSAFAFVLCRSLFCRMLPQSLRRKGRSGFPHLWSGRSPPPRPVIVAAV